jgi:hypothetical protein
MSPLDFPAVATSIRIAHARLHAAAGDALCHARRTGELLLLVKERLPHGQWESWVVAHCNFTPRSASTYMRIARDYDKLPPLDETSCRGALQALTRKPGYRKPPRPRPTAREVAGYMAEFDVSGKIEDVIRFLRVVGVRVRGDVDPSELTEEQIGSSAADLPTTDPVALADPGPLPSEKLGVEPSVLTPFRPEELVKNPTALAPWAPALTPPPVGRRLELTQRADVGEVSPSLEPPHDQGGVLAAEAEAGRDGRPHGHGAGAVGDVVEVALGVGVGVVDGRRHDPVVKRQRQRGRLHRAGGADQVAHHRLDGG